MTFQLSDIFAPLTISSAKPTRRLQTAFHSLLLQNLLHKKHAKRIRMSSIGCVKNGLLQHLIVLPDFEEGGQSGARGRTRAAQGINVNMRYIEDRNGQPINGHLASDIRRHARAIFVGFALQGRLFTSWTEADHTSLKTYYLEMAERFEELRLCANDWKSEMIALDIYRTWREQWQKKKKKNGTGKDLKNEQFEGNKDCDESDDDDDENVHMKHGIDRHPPTMNELQRK